MKTKNFIKTTLLSATIVAASLSGVTAIYADATPTNISTIQEVTKYPTNIMSILRSYFGVPVDSTSADSQINALAKVQVMDIYLASQNNSTDGQFIRDGVNDIFNISLDTISENGEGSFLASYELEIMQGVRESLNLSPSDTSLDSTIMAMTKVEVMDRFLDSYGSQITGTDIRRVINEIFGVNLTGISGLEHARLSIYSKGQWVLDSPTNVLIISSSKGDIDLYVGVTDYYIQQLGTDQLPTELQTFLINLGFVYNTTTHQYDYHNSAGTSVSDALKSQVINKLVATIQSDFINL